MSATQLLPLTEQAQTYSLVLDVPGVNVLCYSSPCMREHYSSSALLTSLFPMKWFVVHKFMQETLE